MLTSDSPPRLTPARRLRFLGSYAWRDLFERSAWGTTAVIMATLAVVVALTLLAFGLAEGFERVRLARLKNDPQTLCLWVGYSGEPILQHDRARIREHLVQRFGAEDAIRGAFPFREVPFHWVDGSDPTQRPQVLGRTLAPGDPLLQGRAFRSGGAFRDASAEGVVVSRHMLEQLHLSPDAPPAEIELEGHSGVVRKVPVVGVLEEAVPPNNLGFVITEPFYVALRTQDQNVRSPQVRTGPVPGKWPEPEDLPELMKRALQQYGVMTPVLRTYRGQDVWVLTSRGGIAYRLNVWKSYLEGLQRTAKELNLPTDPAFGQVTPLQKLPEEPLPEPTRLALYLRDLPHLKPAAEEIDKLGFFVNKDVVAQIESIHRSSAAIRTLLTAIILVIGVQAGWGMTVIQGLRARQKVTEIGMLKAMGVDNQLMRQLYLAESAVLWLFGALLGAGLGVFAGWAIENWLPGDAQGRMVEFDCPWFYLVGAAGGALVLCLLSTLVATHRARKASPIESLTTS
jgi:hypothetical protein